MPNIVMGNSSGGLDNAPSIEVRERNKYPLGMDLSPESALHERIVSRLNVMINDSYSVISNRYSEWETIDKTLRGYIHLQDAEKLLKSNSKGTKPVSIVVPYTYAVRETILAYMTKAFLSDSIFQYDGVGPEDTVAAKLLEIVVNQQAHRFKSALDIHVSVSDALSYGIGASTPIWTERWGKKATVDNVPKMSVYGSIVGNTRVKVNRDSLLFEGNEVIALDPYRILPDPNVSIHAVQHGEFFGWIEFKSFMKTKGEAASDLSLFNIERIQNNKEWMLSSKFRTDMSGRKMTRNDNLAQNTTHYITFVNMYVTLIPREWGIKPGVEGNDGNMPEIWLFTLANERLLVRAQPLNLNHGIYPIATVAPDFDGYSMCPTSRLEMINGLQGVMDFLFNSHVTNVRKALNDMFIVDPSIVHMPDMENPEPGKLIRLRRSAWGKGIDQAIKQFNVHDVTANNMTDVMYVMDMMHKASAASESTMGIIRSKGERVSASEFNGTMSMAVSRLDHIARMVSMQYLQDLAYFHASHTQQLMSQETYIKAIGMWPEVLMKEYGLENSPDERVLVSPYDIVADFDVIFKDGTTPTADAISNDFWTKTFQVLATSPALATQFDLVRIFQHMARVNGAKNVQDFVMKGGQNVNAQIQPTEEVMDQAQAGNVIDFNQMAQMRSGMF